jgi:hypothetical protein
MMATVVPAGALKTRVSPGVDLGGAEPERGRRAEGRDEHAEDVDGPSHGVARRLVGQDERAEQVRQSLAERGVRESHADDAVQRPGVQAPVEDRVLQTQLGARRRGRLGQIHRRCQQVRQRLRHTPEDEADAHAGREHHRDPRHRAELGALVVATQADASVAGRGEQKHHGDEAEGREDVHPTRGVDEPAEDVVGGLGEVLRGDDTPQDERSGDGQRAAEDHVVDRGLTVHGPDRVGLARVHVRDVLVDVDTHADLIVFSGGRRACAGLSRLMKQSRWTGQQWDLSPKVSRGLAEDLRCPATG